MPSIPPREILYKEANARFWAQTGYKPGQKLSKDIAGDRAMMPAWMAALHEVEREAKAGKLVLTYDHPGVQQGLADAAVADQAAAMHLDAAASAPDAATAQTNVAAATIATQVSSQKTREVAAVQPPSIPPQVTNAAAVEAARTPPPSYAPSAEHLAHARTQQPPFSPRDVLIQETNVRFWTLTGYKPGEKLDMSNPTDRKMSKKWLSVFRQVQHEAATGRLVLSPPYAPPSYVPPPAAHPSYVPPPAAQPSYVPPSVSPAPPTAPDVAWPPPQVQTAPTVAPDTSTDTSAEPPPPEDKPKPFPIGKVLAIAAALAAAGGLVYMATRRPERTPSRPRARPPKFVTTPTRAVRAVPMRAVPMRAMRPSSPVRGLLPAGPSRSVRP